MIRWHLPLLACLLLVGLVLGIWRPVSLSTLVEFGNTYASEPWAMVGSVTLLALFLALALPGSLIFWLIAPFHPPWIAVALLLAGSLPGCLAAYGVAATLGQRVRHSRRAAGVMRLMRTRSDLLSQCALRVLPGFPHAVVNYASGILRLRLSGFLLAVLFGLGIKWTLYSTAVYGAAESVRRGEAIGAGTIGLMVGIALFMVVAAWVRRRYWR